MRMMINIETMFICLLLLVDCSGVAAAESSVRAVDNGTNGKKKKEATTTDTKYGHEDTYLLEVDFDEAVEDTPLLVELDVDAPVTQDEINHFYQQFSSNNIFYKEDEAQVVNQVTFYKKDQSQQHLQQVSHPNQGTHNAAEMEPFTPIMAVPFNAS